MLYHSVTMAAPVHLESVSTKNHKTRCCCMFNLHRLEHINSFVLEHQAKLHKKNIGYTSLLLDSTPICPLTSLMSISILYDIMDSSHFTSVYWIYDYPIYMLKLYDPCAVLNHFSTWENSNLHLPIPIDSSLPISLIF